MLSEHGHIQVGTVCMFPSNQERHKLDRSAAECVSMCELLIYPGCFPPFYPQLRQDDRFQLSTSTGGGEGGCNLLSK